MARDYEGRLSDMPEFEYQLWEAEGDLDMALVVAPAPYRAELVSMRDRLEQMRDAQHAAPRKIDRDAS